MIFRADVLIVSEPNGHNRSYLLTNTQEVLAMRSIIYLVGLIVIVMAIVQFIR